MSDQSDRFMKAIGDLRSLAEEMTEDEARASFDDTTLQVFWRDWPAISSWAGGVWRRLSSDLEQPATPPEDPELDETGVGG